MFYWKTSHGSCLDRLSECVFAPHAESVSSASCQSIKHVIFMLFLWSSGRARTSWTQRRRWTRGTKRSFRSPRRCWSSWPRWWEGKLHLLVSLHNKKHKHPSDTVSSTWISHRLLKQSKKKEKKKLFCVVSHVWSGMIAQQDLTSRTAFPIVTFWTATECFFDCCSWTSRLHKMDSVLNILHC